jgi:hypothetical protein
MAIATCDVCKRGFPEHLILDSFSTDPGLCPFCGLEMQREMMGSGYMFKGPKALKAYREALKWLTSQEGAK